MAVSNDCARFLRHPKPFDRGAAVGAIDAILWPDAAILSALCVGWRGHWQANTAVDNARLWAESDGLCAIIGERILELEPNGPAASFGRHANGLPFDAVASWADQRNASVAQLEYATDADFLLGDRTGALCELNLCWRWCGLGRFSWYVSWTFSRTLEFWNSSDSLLISFLVLLLAGRVEKIVCQHFLACNFNFFITFLRNLHFSAWFQINVADITGRQCTECIPVSTEYPTELTENVQCLVNESHAI